MELIQNAHDKEMESQKIGKCKKCLEIEADAQDHVELLRQRMSSAQTIQTSREHCGEDHSEVVGIAGFHG